MKRITSCRLCKSEDLVDLFSLGDQYVSDFVGAKIPGLGEIYPQRVPIEIVLCRGCTLVQQRYSVDIPQQYWYRSGVTDTMKLALRDITESVEKRLDLKPLDIVLDIGSNDGTLLRSYTVPGLMRLGIEPAKNVATNEGYRKHGLELLSHPWPCNALPYDKAKVVTACGMFYDLESPGEFVADVARVLAPDGLFVAQLMCLRNMLNVGDVGNLCHEHVEFYSLKSLVKLFGDNGLEIVDIETNDVNGESYRLYVRHINTEHLDLAGFQRVMNAMKQEVLLDDPAYYRMMKEEWDRNKASCTSFIRKAVTTGKKVWIYGASTKGNVLLQYYGLDASLITAAAERSSEKYGLYTVGTGIPIVSEEEFRRAAPDYTLVLPYCFLPEFVKRESEWLKGGGRFLVALPNFEVVREK